MRVPQRKNRNNSSAFKKTFGTHSHSRIWPSSWLGNGVERAAVPTCETPSLLNEPIVSNTMNPACDDDGFALSRGFYFR